MKKDLQKYQEFLCIAGKLNRSLQAVPLLFGSLGLARRLNCDLGADDIDILLPQVWLGAGWDSLISLMQACDYTLTDLHEHAFEKNGLSVAFASLESLGPFAGVDVPSIPKITDGDAHYLLLDLHDYLRVYEASSKDGYRRAVKNKQDQAKILRIQAALSDVRSFSE